MKSLVVLFFVVASAVAAPSHLHAVAYSAPVVEAVAPVATVYSGASAVSHQSRVDVRSSPAIVATAPVVSAPIVSAPAAVVAEPVAYAAAPISTVYAGGSAVSHQSRYDVSSSPAVYASAPVYAAAAPVVEARTVYAAAPALHPAVYSSVW